jgi:hypothetical protein
VVDDLTAAGIPEETIERLDGPDDATLAAARRLPVLFAEPDGVPPATAETLVSLSVQRTLVVGDVSSVGER